MLVLLLFLETAGSPLIVADPLSHWEQLNPLPTSNPLHAVTYGGAFYVAVGELGAVVVSPDATNWTARATGSNVDLYGVAWGMDRFVAVGDGGAVLTSDDSESWALAHLDESVVFRSVTFAVDRFVAVGENTTQPPGGEVWLSLDGFVWTRIDIPELPPLRSVAAGTDGCLAVGEGGRSFFSDDGLHWDSAETGIHGPLFGAAFGEGAWVVVGPDATLLHSAATGEWTSVEVEAEEWFYAAAHGIRPFSTETVFVVVGAGGRIVTSADGLTWQVRTAQREETLRGVTYGSAGFVAVGDQGMIRRWNRSVLWPSRSMGPRDWMVGATQGGGITLAASAYYDLVNPGSSRTTFLISSNGMNWTQQTRSDFWLRGLTYGQGLFVAVGSSYDNNPRSIMTSTDGLRWTLRHSGDDWLYDVAYGNGRFVAVGENWLNYNSNGSCRVSTDGTNWTLHDVGTMDELAAIAWGNDRFVAVGHRGTVTSSPDGESWTRRESGTEEYLRDVTWGDGLFVAVGHEGTLLTSPDGATWTRRDPGTRQSLNGVAHGAGWFVVGGGAGTLLVSANGIEWEPRFVGSRARLGAVAWAEGSFLLMGNYGLLLRSERLLETGPAMRQPPTPISPPIVRAQTDGENSGSERPALRPMGGGYDTNLHHISAIRHVRDQGVELTLAGAIPIGFEFDLFPVETSNDLLGWQAWRTFLRTNQHGRTLTRWDDSVGAWEQRFYRTASNQFPVTTIQPTGPHAVGRTVRWITLDTHPVRNTFFTYVWYPAQPHAGQVPGRFFHPRLAGSYATRNDRTETEFRMVRTHALEEAAFATDLANCPVVLVSHGFLGANNGMVNRAEELASHGFVVIAIDAEDAPYSLDPNLAVLPATYYEPFGGQFAGRVKDALGVIDHLPAWNQHDPLFAARLAPDTVGMLGWSMGGATAMEVARSHPHCRAAINLDGGTPHDYLRAGDSKALLFVSAGNNTWRDFPQAIREFVESLPGDAVYFRIRNANHGHLNEWHWWGERRLVVRELTRRAITSFFQKQLKGVDDGFFDVLESEYPDVFDHVQR